MFDLASGYQARGMAAYSELQQREFAAEKSGYTCVRHQVGRLSFFPVPFFCGAAARVWGKENVGLHLRQAPGVHLVPLFAVCLLLF